MKKYFSFLVLALMALSCEFLWEGYEGFFFQNTSEEHLIVFPEGKHPNDSIPFAVSNALNSIPAGYNKVIACDKWEMYSGKIDSVYLYIISYDLLFPDNNWHLIEDIKELDEEVLIARLSYKFSDLYVKCEKCDVTVIFPPSADSGVPVVWYNGYSASDFLTESK